LSDPAVLAAVAAIFLVSAVGQALGQAYLHEESVAVVAGFSIAGSLFLTVAIVTSALRNARINRKAGPSQRRIPSDPLAAPSATVPGGRRQRRNQQGR
jgi:hypothetical protein